MKKFIHLAILSSALTLAGCDGTSSPAGAGAGTSETMTELVNEVQAREKALTVARQNGTAIEVQLSGLIADAVQELRPRWNGDYHPLLGGASCILGIDLSYRQEVLNELIKSGAGEIKKGMGMDILIDGTKEENNAACVAFVMDVVLSPVSSWPGADHRVWAHQKLGQSLGISKVMAPIANSLSKNPGATVEELKAQAREILLENANDLRMKLVDGAAEIEGQVSNVSIDFTGRGPAPVHFTLGGIDYQGGPGGPVVSRRGAIVFGNGYLESVRYTVEAVATSGQSITRSSTNNTTSESSNTATINAEARTQ